MACPFAARKASASGIFYTQELSKIMTTLIEMAMPINMLKMKRAIKKKEVTMTKLILIC